MDFGDDFPEGSDSHGQQQNNRRKRYHRHTPRQIQTLEGYVLLLNYAVPFLFLAGCLSL